ncbi:hypothetical protein Mapa_016593 [Marchantia paleacea]|nr:hypothetical protein Mapa_016593 [Marchantia paleacea]
MDRNLIRWTRRGILPADLPYLTVTCRSYGTFRCQVNFVRPMISDQFMESWCREMHHFATRKKCFS